MTAAIIGLLAKDMVGRELGNQLLGFGNVTWATLLFLLATFLGVKPEPPADPNDAAYIPRPEWYFLWAFETLKHVPAAVAGINGELIAVAVMAAGALAGILFFPFLDPLALVERNCVQRLIFPELFDVLPDINKILIGAETLA